MSAPFRIAEPPAKADILALLDETRVATEAGEVVAVVVIPIGLNQEWRTRSAGDICMLELAGLLGVAWHAAIESCGR